MSSALSFYLWMLANGFQSPVFNLICSVCEVGGWDWPNFSVALSMWTMECHSFLGPLGSGAQVFQTRFPLRKWDVSWGYVKNLLRTNVRCWLESNSSRWGYSRTSSARLLCNDPQWPSGHRAGELTIAFNRSSHIMNLIEACSLAKLETSIIIIIIIVYFLFFILGVNSVPAS